MKSYQKKFIQMALQSQALRFGEFTLKSGRKSPYFFNVGQLNTGAALKALGLAYADAIVRSKLQFDVLFGPAYKGIPLACTTAIALAERSDVPFCFNRKEVKDHGEGGQIVGAALKGRVLVIDDVITAGTAIREAFQLIQQANATLAGIIVAFDRQEKGQDQHSAIQEIQAAHGVPITAIINFTDMMTFVAEEPDFQRFLPALHAYREAYGAI